MYLCQSPSPSSSLLHVLSLFGLVMATSELSTWSFLIPRGHFLPRWPLSSGPSPITRSHCCLVRAPQANKRHTSPRQAPTWLWDVRQPSWWPGPTHHWSNNDKNLIQTADHKPTPPQDKRKGERPFAMSVVVTNRAGGTRRTPGRGCPLDPHRLWLCLLPFKTLQGPVWGHAETSGSQLNQSNINRLDIAINF